MTTAILVSDGTSPATMQARAGFGTAPFASSPFGGWPTTEDATITSGPTAAVLLDATGTTSLAGNGVGAATLDAAPGLAALLPTAATADLAGGGAGVAAITSDPALSALAATAGTAVLHSSGAGDAATSEVLASAELQLV